MLNEQQLAVVNSTANRILCLAGAGAGKTHTMIERIFKLVSDGVNPESILVLTFTNAAAAEMKCRYLNKCKSEKTPEFRTFHSFCYNLICTDEEVRHAIGYMDVPSIIQDVTYKKFQTQVKTELHIKLSDEIINGKKKSLSVSEQSSLDLFNKRLRKLLIQSSLITFDILCYDICKLFQTHHWAIFPYTLKYKYIFVDEFQDTDPKQWEFVSSFEDAKLFVTGDAPQCQPAGTKITMADMSVKSIEDIEIGDRLLTCYIHEGRYIKHTKKNKDRYTKRVTGISTHFADNVVRITSDTHSSCYTKDHITYAKIHYEGNENSYVTYLMSNDRGWWRVGSTKLFLGSQNDGFGLRIRMRNEKGNRVWILGVYESATDAWMNEQLAAYKYGIPQITWVHKNVKFDIEDAVKLYAELGDLEDKAKICLSAYGRDICYPLFTDADINKHFSKLHLFECRVGNLIPGIFDIIYPEYRLNQQCIPILRNNYEVIKSIEPEANQIVYGLEVEDYHNYVGDGILTHNCIYSFRGADSSIIKSLADNSDWTTYKLDHNYRSTKQICKFSNDISSDYASDKYHIEMKSDRNGEDVNVEYLPADYDTEYMDVVELLSDLTGTTAILARTNKEVRNIQLWLQEQNIEFSTNSSDTYIEYILKSAVDDEFCSDFLSSLLDSEHYSAYMRDISINHPADKTEWLIKNYSTSYIKYIYDKIVDISSHISTHLRNNSMAEISDCCKWIIKRFLPKYDGIPEISSPTKYGIIDAAWNVLNHIDRTKNPVYVGTIHSVKGLEYDNVIVTGVESPSFRINNEDMNNLYYVACTRAKNRLFVFEYMKEFDEF